MADAIHALLKHSDGATKNILAIAGSIRRGSYNHLLLRAAAEHAPKGMQVRIYGGLACIPPFNEDQEAETGGGPETVRHLRAAVAAADGLLIATPEYNQSFPGVLKNVIDWLSRPAPEEVLIGKPIALIGASMGSWGTRLSQAALRQVLNATESAVMPGSALFVRNAASLFDEAGRLLDVQTLEQLTTLLANFDSWINRFKKPVLDDVR
ncbi:MAG: NADPH-dependent FMN reductase [Gammaproteobacteria bacterium]